MFVKPLAGRLKAVAEQRKRAQGEASEAQTVASTTRDKSRKTSTHNLEEEGAAASADDQQEDEEELLGEDVDDGLDEEFKEASG